MYMYKNVYINTHVHTRAHTHTYLDFGYLGVDSTQALMRHHAFLKDKVVLCLMQLAQSCKIQGT